MATPLGLLWSDYSHWASEAARRMSGQTFFYIDILKDLVQTDNKNGQMIISNRAETNLTPKFSFVCTAKSYKKSIADTQK